MVLVVLQVLVLQVEIGVVIVTTMRSMLQFCSNGLTAAHSTFTIRVLGPIKRTLEGGFRRCLRRSNLKTQNRDCRGHEQYGLGGPPHPVIVVY